MHVIAAKAVCFKEALTPEFKAYQQDIVNNAAILAKALMEQGLRVVSGGTDNHHVSGCSSQRILPLGMPKPFLNP